MENTSINDIPLKYKELILYLSQMGHSSNINYGTYNTFIQVLDKDRNVTLQFRLDYPKDAEGKLNFSYLQIAWRIPGHSRFSTPHKFQEATDAEVILNILLFEITDWKLNNIDDKIIIAINKALDSETITSWLKAKEEQIRMEERDKILTHLNPEELKSNIINELNKANISFKLHINDDNM